MGKVAAAGAGDSEGEAWRDCRVRLFFNSIIFGRAPRGGQWAVGPIERGWSGWRRPWAVGSITPEAGGRRSIYNNSANSVGTLRLVLAINNWCGPAGGNGGGRLIFGVGGLDSAQLAQISFADAGILGAQLIGPDGERSPIPEAPVIFILGRERGRLIRAARRRLVR